MWYIIWEPENIVEYNKDYELAEYAPGFVASGSNAGGELLDVDAEGAVSFLPAIGMKPQHPIKSLIVSKTSDSIEAKHLTKAISGSHKRRVLTDAHH